MQKLLFNFNFKPILVLPVFIILIHAVLKHFFANIAYDTAYNTGFAFGLNSNAAFVNILLAFGFLLVFVVLFRKYFLSVGFQLVLGGGLANILDRLLIGRVVDYFLLGQVFIWPSLYFNFADVCVVVGVGVLIVKSLIKPHVGD